MKSITHRCNSKINDDLYNSIDCRAVRYSDGTIENNCGEPCSWVMGKTGYGEPPWQSINNIKTNPMEPDK